MAMGEARAERRRREELMKAGEAKMPRAPLSMRQRALEEVVVRMTVAETRNWLRERRGKEDTEDAGGGAACASTRRVGPGGAAALCVTAATVFQLGGRNSSHSGN